MIAEYPGPRPADLNITCGHSKLTGHNKMLPDGVVGPYDTRLWEILTSREEVPGKLRPTGALRQTPAERVEPFLRPQAAAATPNDPVPYLWLPETVTMKVEKVFVCL